MVSTKREFPSATVILILSWIIVSIFIWNMSGDAQKDFVNDYAYSTSNILDGKWWTFFTSIFIHGSLIHLMSNAIGFFFFGWAVENELGPGKMLGIFLLGAVSGDLFSSLIYPISQLSIGASGGVSAVLGTAILVSPFRFALAGGIMPAPILVIGILYILSNIAAFFAAPADNISYAAHLGGAALGLIWGVNEVGKKRATYLIILGLFLIVLISQLFNFAISLF